MRGIVPDKILGRFSKSNVGSFAEKEILNADYENILERVERNKTLKSLIDITYFKKDVVSNLLKGNFKSDNNLLRSYLVISLLSWLEKKNK